jgi:hypothetical protein
MENLTMSETKLNLTDAQHTINGTIHGSVADACVAALSAEPETIIELEAALARYHKPDGDVGPFGWFWKASELDTVPWDAGIVVIDLAARIVTSESTYSKPGLQGEVRYHDGTCSTDTSISYRLPDDWMFLDSIEEYECLRERRRQERAITPRFDARDVLYGRPLIEWIVSAVYANEAERSIAHQANQPTSPVIEAAFAASAGVSRAVEQTSLSGDPKSGLISTREEVECSNDKSLDPDDALRQKISAIHARWLMTPRDDLHQQSPRSVLLAKQDLIDYDMHTRSMQWSIQGEGPPCLATDSFAYRFAGFGTHEWVVYYDLVRHLLWNALSGQDSSLTAPDSQTEYLQRIARLEELKKDWLEKPQEEYDGRIPALLIENERIRLPIAMRVHDMAIDDDCPVCQMMANDAEWGMEVGFWHLDGSHMDDDFAFSDLRTHEEWEGRRREWEEFTENFNREWEERQQRERLAGAEPAEYAQDNVRTEPDI